MQFHAIASTGRTATTFIARALNNLPETAATHEGYLAADKEADPLLPLINLENRQAFYNQDFARRVVTMKRNAQIVDDKALSLNCLTLVDVAYYNSTLAEALLESRPDVRMVGIIRDLESFVRSATAVSGEDPLPVGWPDPAKELTQRERFIEMGRLRPAKGSDDAASWDGWSAIMRNIWLWQVTNSLLLKARERFGNRMLILPFEDIRECPETFLGRIAGHFDIAETGIAAALSEAKEHVNRKPSGYQIGPSTEWSDKEQSFAQEAEEIIGSML